MPHCYIICTLHILWWMTQDARFYCTDCWIISTSNILTYCVYMKHTNVNIYQLLPVQVLLLFPLILLLPCATRWARAGGNGSRGDVGCVWQLLHQVCLYWSQPLYTQSKQMVPQDPPISTYLPIYVVMSVKWFWKKPSTDERNELSTRTIKQNPTVAYKSNNY
jgi:hypothetical protein